MSGGYVMVPGWLLALRPTGNHLKVYCALARYGTFNTLEGVYEECRPAVPTICQDADLSESVVHRSLRWLREQGAIIGTERRNEDGGQAPTVYRVIFGSLVRTPPGAATDTPPVPAETPPGVPPPAPNPEPTSTQNQNTQTTAPPGGDASAPPAPGDKPETAQDVVAAWIDYCAGRDIKLPKQVIGRYAGEIKKLLDQEYPTLLVKQALARMLQRGKASNPALLPAFVVEVQGKRPPGSSGILRYDRRTAAERGDDRRGEQAAIAEIADRLAAEQGATGKDPAENMRITRQAREIWEARQKDLDRSTSCQVTGYSGADPTPSRVVEDAQWWPAHPTPREVTAT